MGQDTLVLYRTELSATSICRASSRADPVPLTSITHNSTAKLPLGILLWISPLSPRALRTEPLKKTVQGSSPDRKGDVTLQQKMLMSSKLCQENQCSSSRRFLLDNFVLDLVIVPESYKMRGKEEVQCMTNELILKSNIKLEGLEQALNIGDYKLGRWNVDTIKQEKEHRKVLLFTGFCCTNMFC